MMAYHQAVPSLASVRRKLRRTMKRPWPVTMATRKKIRFVTSTSRSRLRYSFGLTRSSISSLESTTFCELSVFSWSLGLATPLRRRSLRWQLKWHLPCSTSTQPSSYFLWMQIWASNRCHLASRVVLRATSTRPGSRWSAIQSSAPWFSQQFSRYSRPLVSSAFAYSLGY